jgi:hypothetical protein
MNPPGVPTKGGKGLPKLSKVQTKGGPAAIINDPAMPQVRNLATHVLELLKHEME